MALRLESKAAAAARVRREFDGYAASILLSEVESAAVIGFSEHSLKHWRHHAPEKGPTPTYMHGKVFYRAGELRRWISHTEADHAA